MSKVVLLNGLMNFIFGVVFVSLNIWALQNNFEETFIFLAILYGVIAIVGNVLYTFLFCRK